MKELLGALCKALQQLGGVEKDANNSHFKNDYATLESVVRAAKAALTPHGLAFYQETKRSGSDVVCYTTIVHGESGQTRTAEYVCGQPVKGTPADWGSITTYARRYGLLAALGLYQTDEDDDGASQEVALAKAVTEARKLLTAYKKAGEREDFDAYLKELQQALPQSARAELRPVITEVRKVRQWV